MEFMVVRFVVLVVMDFKILVEEKKDNFRMVIELVEKCIELGKKIGEINLGIILLEMLVVFFMILFRYLLFLIEFDKNKIFIEDEIKRVV